MIKAVFRKQIQDAIKTYKAPKMIVEEIQSTDGHTFFTYKDPLCLLCNSEQIDFYGDDVMAKKICRSCRIPKMEPIKPLPILIKGGVKGIFVGGSESYGKKNMTSIQITQQKNNIRLYVQGRLNVGKYSSNYYRSSLLPQKIYTDIPPIDSITAGQIIKNRQNQQFLPLKIRESTIKNAGFGVFATQKLDKNKIVASYIGQQIFPQQYWPSSDSLYGLGWILNQQNQKFVGIEPIHYFNVGRFINTEVESACNCKIELCLVNQQISLYLYTTKVICEGEQLFYSYGSNFPASKKFKTSGKFSRKLTKQNNQKQIDSIPVEKYQKLTDLSSTKLRKLPRKEAKQYIDSIINPKYQTLKSNYDDFRDKLPQHVKIHLNWQVNDVYQMYNIIKLLRKMQIFVNFSTKMLLIGRYTKNYIAFYDQYLDILPQSIWKYFKSNDTEDHVEKVIDKLLYLCKMMVYLLDGDIRQELTNQIKHIKQQQSIISIKMKLLDIFLKHFLIEPWSQDLQKIKRWDLTVEIRQMKQYKTNWFNATWTKQIIYKHMLGDNRMKKLHFEDMLEQIEKINEKLQKKMFQKGDLQIQGDRVYFRGSSICKKIYSRFDEQYQNNKPQKPQIKPQIQSPEQIYQQQSIQNYSQIQARHEQQLEKNAKEQAQIQAARQKYLKSQIKVTTALATTRLTKQQLGLTYRTFSRIKYNSLAHKHPRMKDHEIISSVIKQWYGLSAKQLQDCHKLYRDENLLKEQSQSQCKSVCYSDKPSKLKQSFQIKKSPEIATIYQGNVRNYVQQSEKSQQQIYSQSSDNEEKQIPEIKSTKSRKHYLKQYRAGLKIQKQQSKEVRSYRLFKNYSYNICMAFGEKYKDISWQQYKIQKKNKTINMNRLFPNPIINQGPRQVAKRQCILCKQKVSIKYQLSHFKNTHPYIYWQQWTIVNLIQQKKVFVFSIYDDLSSQDLQFSQCVLGTPDHQQRHIKEVELSEKYPQYKIAVWRLSNGFFERNYNKQKKVIIQQKQNQAKKIRANMRYWSKQKKIRQRENLQMEKQEVKRKQREEIVDSKKKFKLMLKKDEKKYISMEKQSKKPKTPRKKNKKTKLNQEI